MDRYRLIEDLSAKISRRKLLAKIGAVGVTAAAGAVLIPDRERTYATGVSDLYVNVKDFGAAGDGVTDDTASIQAALASLNATYGGTVFFPAGEYVISATIQLKANQGLLGAGAASSKLLVASDVTAIELSTAGAGNAIARSGVRDMYIRFQNDAGTWTNGHGIRLVADAAQKQIWKIAVENVQIYLAPQSGVHMTASLSQTGNYVAETYLRNLEINQCVNGVYLSGKVYDLFAEMVYVEKARDYGFFISGGSNTFIHCHAVKCGTNTNGTLSGGAFRVDENYNSFYDCHADKSVGHGFILGGFGSTRRNGNRFVACFAFNSGSTHATDGHGFKIGAIGHTVFDGCFIGTLGDDTQPQYHGMLFESADITGITIQGCMFRKNTGTAVKYNAAVPKNQIVFTGGSFELNGQNIDGRDKHGAFYEDMGNTFLGKGMLTLGAAEQLAMSAGILNVTGSYVAASGSGNIDTINGGYEGSVLFLKQAPSSSLTVRHQVGNVVLRGASNYVFASENDVLMLLKCGSNYVQL
ncbi:glycosyl hydrolase family 28-related protein [Paenibacillus sp. HJGM_3]|uniref:glycosyl hydrolase family 28-related protein n=1 Tax=Paenibacillus sp. HJGM_3 TaxID=3379816 RepID=UPI00385EEA45